MTGLIARQHKLGRPFATTAILNIVVEQDDAEAAKRVADALSAEMEASNDDQAERRARTSKERGKNTGGPARANSPSSSDGIDATGQTPAAKKNKGKAGEKSKRKPVEQDNAVEKLNGGLQAVAKELFEKWRCDACDTSTAACYLQPKTGKHVALSTRTIQTWASAIVRLAFPFLPFVPKLTGVFPLPASFPPFLSPSRRPAQLKTRKAPDTLPGNQRATVESPPNGYPGLFNSTHTPRPGALNPLSLNAPVDGSPAPFVIHNHIHTASSSGQDSPHQNRPASPPPSSPPPLVLNSEFYEYLVLETKLRASVEEKARWKKVMEDGEVDLEQVSEKSPVLSADDWKEWGIVKTSLGRLRTAMKGFKAAKKAGWEQGAELV